MKNILNIFTIVSNILGMKILLSMLGMISSIIGTFWTVVFPIDFMTTDDKGCLFLPSPEKAKEIHEKNDMKLLISRSLLFVGWTLQIISTLIK